MLGMLSRWQGMHLLDHLRFVQYVSTRHLFSESLLGGLVTLNWNLQLVVSPKQIS
jgi:hypothetical protein